MVEIDELLRTLIDDGASSFQIEQHARAKGQFSMRDAGIQLVADGETDIAEFNRVLGE